MVMEAVLEDNGEEGSMQCIDHPYNKTHTPPGGICPLCLQEKLGKLVSSSSFFPSASSSSPSPSFRSDSLSSRLQQIPQNAPHPSSRRSRLPFFASSSHKKDDPVVFKRSKSTSNGGGNGNGNGNGNRMRFLDSYSEFNSPRKRGFWSFLKHHHHHSSNKTTSKEICYGGTPSTSSMRGFPHTQARSQRIEEEEAECSNLDNSPNHPARVSRSRSVGCGSRSFHGDFFERISTGFGDCTLRRVESQREGGKSRATPGRRAGGGGGGQHDCIKERVKCGGIFGGFTMNASSSSSSSSSSYWVSSSSAEGQLSHGRSKSWGWALASPMRGFSKPPLKREASNSNNKNTATATATPNLNAIPSLLTVGS